MTDIAAVLVRELRALTGRSQRALAESAGTAQSVVGRIEAGLTSPTVDSLERLAHAAGFELRLTCVPAPVVDPVIEAYKPGVDRTLLVANLRMSPRQRFEQLLAARRFILKARRVGAEARRVGAEAHREEAEARRKVAEPPSRYGKTDE